jgi:hypothetical protein
MAELKYKPVVHDHKAFLAKAEARKGFPEAYAALELEYQVAGQMLKARCSRRAPAQVSHKTLLPNVWARRRAPSPGSNLRANTRHRFPR